VGLINLPKAPTSLAFTTSLLSTSLSRPNCKKYLAIFSASTPLSAIASYVLFSSLGEGNEGNLIGTALLISVRFYGGGDLNRAFTEPSV